MTRTEFTDKITLLLRRMIEADESPILDFVKRSDEEQRRLFDAKLSQCDGVVKISRHQTGRAADIYFVDPETRRLTDPVKGLEYWHIEWLRLGGHPMIEWDQNHFE